MVDFDDRFRRYWRLRRWELRTARRPRTCPPLASPGVWLATTNRHVTFESWCERDHLIVFDFNPDIIGVTWSAISGSPGVAWC